MPYKLWKAISEHRGTHWKSSIPIKLDRGGICKSDLLVNGLQSEYLCNKLHSEKRQKCLLVSSWIQP